MTMYSGQSKPFDDHTLSMVLDTNLSENQAIKFMEDYIEAVKDTVLFYGDLRDQIMKTNIEAFASCRRPIFRNNDVYNVVKLNTYFVVHGEVFNIYDVPLRDYSWVFNNDYKIENTRNMLVEGAKA